MLPLPPFRFHEPTSVTEAVALLDRLGPSAMLIAGGTDLVPNMKRGLFTPSDVISLRGLTGLTGVREEDDAIRVGAMTTLEAMAASPLLQAEVPVLTEAAKAVGGPQHRRMGTIGGNLCLDTRCRYYDQTEFWRCALGYCLKKDGQLCHVVPKGKKCVAAASNDTGAPAIALDAVLELTGPKGSRELSARDFYTADGIMNMVKEPSELVVALRIPKRKRVSAYEKLRRRGAIDFPLLSIAVVAEIEDGRVKDLEVVVSALAARPRRMTSVKALANGKALKDVPVEEIAQLAHKECNPVPNVDEDVAWRKRMVPVLVGRAMRRAGLGGAEPLRLTQLGA